MAHSHPSQDALGAAVESGREPAGARPLLAKASEGQSVKYRRPLKDERRSRGRA